MQMETIVLNETRNVTLTAYLQDVGGPFAHVTQRPALLILPGGGYQYCSRRESDPVAFAFLKAGFQVFILNYSVRQHAQWPNPLSDYDQAMTQIRDNANSWGLHPDKVAVIGFSAGGHLAAAAATMAQNRPNAAILGYAVAGEDVKGCSPTAPDTTLYVDENTCPCFLFATRTDQVVPIQNSLRFMQALAQADVAFESHIYAYGPHGFSVGDTAIQLDETDPLCPRAQRWTEDCIAWLKDVLGDFGPDGFTAPACRHHTTGDREPWLSVDCTMGCLMKNEQARALLEPLFAQAMSQLGQQEAAPEDKTAQMEKAVLRGILGFMRMTPQELNALNEQLHRIPNC